MSFTRLINTLEIRDFSHSIVIKHLCNTAFFSAVKNDNFQLKYCDIFLIFALNINCGYMLVTRLVTNTFALSVLLKSDASYHNIFKDKSFQSFLENSRHHILKVFFIL